MATKTATTYFVDAAAGDDGNDGISSVRPFKTIQLGCDRLQPGDTLIVARGVYYENIVLKCAGTADAPIRIQAESCGKFDVLITGADRAIRERQRRWELVDPELGLYAISFPTPPHRINYGEIDLCPYAGMEQLKAFRVEPNWPGPDHGFYYDPAEQKIYARLDNTGKYGPADPNRQTMNVGGPPGEGKCKNLPADASHFLIGVLTDTPAYVVIDGFTFQSPGVCAIFAGSDHFTVSNCWFIGCLAAVSGRGSFEGQQRKGDHVRILNCDYSEPDLWGELVRAVDQWAGKEGIKEYWWWARKEAYERGMVSEANDDWELAHCYLHDCFEALSFMAFGHGSSNCHVHHNVFDRSVDNHIEFEYEMTNFVMHDNLFVDAFRPISYQAFDRRPGPIWFFRNVIITTDQCLDLFTRTGHRGGTWNKFPVKHPIPEPGLLVYNNTVLSRNDSGKGFDQNLHLFNNIFHLVRCTEPVKHPEFDGNVVYSQEPSHAAWLAGDRGLLVEAPDQLGLVVEGDYNDWRTLRLKLLPTSPAVTHAIASPSPLTGLKDPHLNVCGASAVGEVWSPPMVGPQVKEQS